MKNLSKLFYVLMFSSVATGAYAQKAGDASYRRSSISLFLVDEASMPKRDAIIDAFLASPVPDKYNDHNVDERIIKASDYVINDADREAFRQAVAAGAAAESSTSATAPKKKTGFGALAKGVAGAALSTSTGSSESAVVDQTDKEQWAAVSYKYMMEQKVAKQMFDKWFIDGDGEFSMDMVKERGMYDATLSDVKSAKNSVRGMGMLADAGEELIGNTFVVVSRFRYMSKEELIEELNSTTQVAAAGIGGKVGAVASLGASVGSVGAQAALGAGYYVRTISFLFQLTWDETVSNEFYTQLWGDRAAYDNADIFKLKYIGMESAFAGVKANVFTKKSEEELIQIATINATDAVLAKLERQYDVFKTKTPLLTAEPLTAAIGMKEGVVEGDKYEVLEKSLNETTGKTEYKRAAVIKVEKGQVWDNRFLASEEAEATGETQAVKVTRFEGSSTGLYPGMLLRQTK